MRGFFFLGLILLLTGCAGHLSEPYQSNPRLSEANNVLWAADVTNVRDAEAGGVAKDDTPGMLGAASFGALQGLNSGSMFTGMLGATAWLTTGNTDESHLYPAFFAWMPLEQAADARQAQQKMQQMVNQAARSALKGVRLPEGYYVKEQPGPHGRILIGGNECDRDDVTCGYKLSVMEPQKGLSPDFLGQYPAWVWTRHTPGAINIWPSYEVSIGKYKKERQARLPDVEVYTLMSEYLPQWSYGYLSPLEEYISHCDENACRFLKIPLVTHQGKNLLFVKPQQADKTASR